MTKLRFAPQAVQVDRRNDGSLILRSPQPLGPYARSVGEKLTHWAEYAPDRIFLSETRRDTQAPSTGTDGSSEGPFPRHRKLTYKETLARVRAIGQALLDRGLGRSGEENDSTRAAASPLDAPRPIAILSDNSVDHALLSLAANHVGVPVAPVSVAYSLLSKDNAKLRQILTLVRPAIVYAADGSLFEKAILAAVAPETEVVVSQNPLSSRAATLFSGLLSTRPTPKVESAFAQVGPDTTAKVLFTSGSTGTPKGVLNTQRMLCSNQQAIAQLWPFLAEKPPVIVDWLPWSHTFGGNHNFFMALWHGGTLHVDDGKPAPHLMGRSIENLTELPPTLYFNVPRGYEMLLPYLEQNKAFRDVFFSRLDFLFYAAAALPRPLWDRLARVSTEARGEVVPMLSAWGATETSPLITSVHFLMDGPGVIGLPAPGTDVLLVPEDNDDLNGPYTGRFELRARGPNVTQGYLNDPAATAQAFDEDGFYRTGDSGKFADPARPEQGIVFQGRIAEDFKLTSGTWVHVGLLRLQIIAACAPLVADVVVTGHDCSEVGALLLPNLEACRRAVPNAPAELSPAEFVTRPEIVATVRERLSTFSRGAGSSQRVTRALILVDPPSIDAGEITDKGYINQRAVRERRSADVLRLHDKNPDSDVLVVEHHPSG